jgi:ATP-binding cassette subfamily B protein
MTSAIASMIRTTPRHARWIAAHWRPYRREVPILVALTLTNAVIVVIQPLFIKRVVEGIERAAGKEPIVEGVVGLALLGIGRFLLYVFLQGSRARLNLRFDFGVRLRAFENVLRMGPSFFVRFRVGDVVTRLTDDVSDKLSWYMCSGLLRTLEALVLIVFGVAMMIRLNPKLTLYTAGPLPILIALFILTATRLHKRYEAVQASISRLNESLENCFSGIRVVKAFAGERYQQGLVHRAIDAQRTAELRAVRWQSIIDSLYGHIWQFAIIGVLLAGGGMVMRKEITLGELAAFEAYVLLLVWPMFDAGQFLVRGRLSAVSIDRIAELEGQTPEVSEVGDEAPLATRPDGPIPVEPAAAHESLPCPVRFTEVSYVFSGATEPALSRVSFEALPATMTALVGEIGSGKSTLLTLVPRLVDPTSGSVSVASKSVRDWAPGDLRRQLGYVTQEAILFSTTVDENIRLGRPWVSDGDVDWAIGVVGLRDEVESWPAGLGTAVGPRGLRLSGGQKQRVALARALAGRPSVLLLDDCTASLDAEKEAEVWDAILKTLPACTTLVVSHRPATLERADQILVLERGRVIEQGSFTTLDRPRSRFRELYAHWKLVSEVEQ